KNLAELVWNMLTMFSLPEKVIAFIMDNTSNNDTMLKALKLQFKDCTVDFSACCGCLCCMPHTIHSAALKLLEGIGVISEAESTQASSHHGEYQETINICLGQEYDEAATHQIGDNTTKIPVWPDQGIPHSLKCVHTTLDLHYHTC
ncbi:hypothetical protein BDN71DRAFT_1392674, partial [Pleurotus eryngii]